MTVDRTQPDPLVAAAAALIDARRLLACGQAVLVGVSGGPDSVALLAVLRELARRPDRAYRLSAAHLDHGLRDSGEADAGFVADLAGRWDIPCVVERREVRGAAAAERLSVEAAARKVRYDFLAEAARRRGATAVAVGHHADDNVETVLYRIVRGTHLRGLSGIPAKRPLGAGGLQLVRPLLAARREEIEAYCRRQQLTWRIDETNADAAYRRNFIRHELLPLLRERLNDRADDAVLRLARAAGDVEAFLADRGREALARASRDEAPRRATLDARALAAEHPVVRTYALRAALEGLAVPLGRLTAEQLADLARLAEAEPPAATSLPGGWVARRQGDELVLEAGPLEAARADRERSVACPGQTVLDDGWRVHCELRPFDAASFRRHCRSHADGVEMIDAERVRGRLRVRRRRDGDAFVPLGAPGTQSVSDFLTNRKLPRRRRDEVRCITDEEGIVYLAPLRIADRVRVREGTRTVLQFIVRPGEQPQ